MPAPGLLRTLKRYGIATNNGAISGKMMRMALVMISEEQVIDTAISSSESEAQPLTSDWAEELSAISYRRNVIEHSLRSIVINFLRFSALSSKESSTAKTSIIAAVSDKRRVELEPFNLDLIAEKLYWLEVITIINKHWSLFERVFGDKTVFNQNANIVNDRPDAHAKKLEPSGLIPTLGALVSPPR